MSIKSYIPNTITMLNLLSGCIAVLLAVNNHLVLAAGFAFLGIFFDFFDGFFARKFNVQSEIGVQLDSLADMVTSGLVPAIVLFKLITLASSSDSLIDLSNEWNTILHIENVKIAPLSIFGLFVALASAYRLAKFNVDTEQQTYFKGLPTPANTLLILSLPLIMEFQDSDMVNALILTPWFLVALSLLSCYLLNSKIKLFALKFKDFTFKNNSVRFIFLALSVIFIVLFKYSAIPLIILSYIILSLLNNQD